MMAEPQTDRVDTPLAGANPVPSAASEKVSTSAAAGVAFFAFAALGLFLRAPDTLMNPQLMAEDATIFYAEQFDVTLPLLFKPHQGYLVLLARLVAWISSPFAAVHVAFVYNLVWLLLSAGSIAYFCLRARALFHPCASFAVILLLPMVSGELFGMVANVQWFGQLATVAACLLPMATSPRPSRGLRTAQLVGLTVFALNGPFAILCGFVYFGLMSAHWISGLLRIPHAHRVLSDYLNSLDDASVAITMIAGLILVIVVGGQDALPAQRQASVAADFVRNVGGEGLQVHLIGLAYLGQKAFVCWQAALLVVVFFWRAQPGVRISCLALLGYGWLCLLAGYLKMKAIDMPIGDFNYIDRYMLALVIFEWLVIWKLFSAVPFFGETVSTCLIATTLAAIGLRDPSRLLREPPRDLSWQTYARRIDAGEAVDVPINPIPWQFHVPAREKQR